MDRELMLQAGKYKKRRRLRHLWKRIVSVLGCFVVFCTTYALILPAITQERETFCGLEPHLHETECYIQGTEIDHYKLICTYESLGVHQHNEDCYNEQEELTCELVDYVVHTHEAACYDEQGNFSCSIPAVPVHEHTEECYRLEGGHAHGEECHAFSRGALICQLPEEEAHAHGEGCFAPGENLLCTLEAEHVHGDACYAESAGLSCGFEQEHMHGDGCYGTGETLLCMKEENHQHTESCYAKSSELQCGYDQEHQHADNCYGPGALTCSLAENHFHDDGCFSEQTLICAETAEDHQHGDACWSERTLLCSLPEGHIHENSCYEVALLCEIPEHTHADCYAEPTLVCEKEEHHQHDASCFETVLLCETDEHLHSDACAAPRELICTVPEGHVHTAECYEQLLICQRPETMGHIHSDACYEQLVEWVCTLEEVPGEPVLDCTLHEVPVHVHNETCYHPVYVSVLECTTEEHVHGLMCYSNPEADVETQREWERTFAHVELTEIWETDVLAIAASQLGYHESTDNYIVLEDGETTRGYTRYGAWYGAPYSDWCAMYASFCLHYAQVEGMPLEAHCQKWIWALSEPEVDLYRTTEEYRPKPGDLIFFDYDEDDRSDHVGFVVEISDVIKTIEGNSDDRVRNVTYELDDETIMGYGLIPEILNQLPDEPVEYYCGSEEHAHNEQCVDAEGVLICEVAEHTHDENCLVEPEPEEPEQPVEYCCGSEEHAHNEQCVDAEGVLICEVAEHTHDESCFVEPETEEPEQPVEYYCGSEEHAHNEQCVDTEGVLICEVAEHTHDENCFVEPEPEEPEQLVEYYCGFEEHTHIEQCVDAEGIFICELTEHTHDETCLSAPAPLPQYFCGLEEHAHGEQCLDSEGNFICELTEHTHEEACLIAPEPTPEYFCGLEEHAHGEQCLDSEGNFICTLTEHAHDETCFNAPAPPPEYFCGLEEHAHGEQCLDSEGNFICELTEHTHDESCCELVHIKSPHQLVCLLEEHAHGEQCLDAEGNFICTLEEHTHDDSCYEDVHIKSPRQLVCKMEEHAHSEQCLDAEGNFICALLEHVHDDNCYAELPLIEFICGLDEHLHTAECYNEANELVCTTPEHIHDELCKPEDGYYCGLRSHAHAEECYDENGNLICEREAHAHDIACTADLSAFSQDLRRQIREVILMVDELPTADAIDERIDEYEAVGDYEGEEIWLTKIYQQVQKTYRAYALLPSEAQEAVIGREKLLEMEYIWAAMPLVDTVIGKTIAYNSSMFTENAMFVVYTQGSDGQYYAFDGNGNAVLLVIDSDGTITANVDDKDILLWSFESTGGSNYRIRNAATGRYMHAYTNNGSAVTTSGNYSSALVAAGNGARVRSNSDYAYLDTASRVFRATNREANGAIYSFGVTYQNYVWLDGTNGGLMSLAGSPDKAYVVGGDTFTLPTTWDSPSKYNYRLRGWYDVINKEYYPPGAEVEVTGNMVFYADWVAATYNIGQNNAQVANTVSTNEFITTRVFDYSTMFNTMSTTANVTVSGSGHSETWSMSDDPNSPGFIFRDWDQGSQDISYPANLTSVNNNGDVYPGLYSAERADLLFDPNTSFDPYSGTGIPGKQYLGTADHLFQHGTDPNEEEHYGYYYYDSHYNAASFHKDRGRFYVYDYLERTSDSSTTHSDFLPFNSPYENTNGKTVPTYSYDGLQGEYSGTTHYMYDAKYTGNGSAADHVGTNYWFGLSIDMDFYLPNKPGTTDEEGTPANQSVYGHDMVFDFSGDDDVWVLVDGQLVLDIGGIHGDERGTINFTTGEVTVNDSQTGSVTYLNPGSHRLTIYYLERGSSMSNCKIRFNLSPRYSLTLQKEDVLTRDMLNGAQFSIYTDAECTTPAELWVSQSSHDRGDAPTNVFTVTNGKTVMWGLAAGNTYYLKETRPPENREETVHGIVVMKLNNQGQATYSVVPDHGALSGGFTVHGYRIDLEEQEAYLVITNGTNVTGTTDVYVRKRWDDSLDHSNDAVTVYLMVNGVAIREVVLSDANNWEYTWPNMPKYYEDGVTLVEYVVREGTVPGYLNRVETITESNTQTVDWLKSDDFVHGETYLIHSYQGYLTAKSGVISFVGDENEAAASTYSRWVASINGSGDVTLRNEAGQTLYYSNYRFRASSSPPNSAPMTYEDRFFREGNSYMCNLASDGTLNAHVRESAVEYIPYRMVEITENMPEGGTGFRITNTPVGDMETVSLTVNKEWSLGVLGTAEMYEHLTVTVELMENGEASGMTVDLSLRNGWSHTFQHLPKFDHDGNEISYTVKEAQIDGPWTPHYGEVTADPGVENTYTTVITNVNTLTYMLPETGGHGVQWYTLGGAALMICAAVLLVYIQKREKRKEASSSF
ncbi:MAG: Cna B-type domain-containing protein [Clostridia bacterium]|nr:Cna B-type domain-containing protein [Clostridia bacterium]